MYRRDTKENYHISPALRGGSKDHFHVSPAITASTGLLTPHSPFDMEARRNSDVSALSLSFNNYSPEYSMPPTPISGRSPFGTDGYDSHAMDLNQAQSMHIMPLEFQMKATSFDEPLGGPWSFPDSSNPNEHSLSVRNNEQLPAHTTCLQSQLLAFTGLDPTPSTAAQSWCSSTTTAGYGGLSSAAEVNYDQPTASNQPFWNMQVHQMQEMVPTTMVPQQSLLGGEYVHVDPDTGMEPDSYDDADVPLTPSPQEVVFKESSSPSWVKAEPDTSEDESKLKRSIHVSPTGGKTVKRERRCGSIPKKKSKPKAKNPQFVARWADGRREYTTAHLEEDPNTGKLRWADHQTRKKLYCKYPYDDDDEAIPNTHPDICGKSFLRPEHRQRHRKTHCPDKDFPCLLCDKNFNRNDNCWAHGFTHVTRPGKKDGRNIKFSLRQVISVIADPKHIEKLLNDWKKEVGTDYEPEDEENDHPQFQDKVDRNGRMEFPFHYNPEDAIRKIRGLPQ